jgi:hypothetical protein
LPSHINPAYVTPVTCLSQVLAAAVPLTGDKAHLRRSVTAPYGGGHDDGAPGSAASGEDTLASFNQASSIDISTLPLYNNALFPVPEVGWVRQSHHSHRLGLLVQMFEALGV